MPIVPPFIFNTLFVALFEPVAYAAYTEPFISPELTVRVLPSRFDDINSEFIVPFIGVVLSLASGSELLESSGQIIVLASA